MNKFSDWATNIGITSFHSKQESIEKNIETFIENINDVQLNKINQKFINNLFGLIKSMNSKTVEKKQLPNEKADELNEKLKSDDYIEESGILNLICLKVPELSETSDDNMIKYAYCKPADYNLIDTNLLDQKKMFKLKGMHITLSSLIEKITNEQLLRSRIAIPRITLLRTSELIKISLIYVQEDGLLIKFAITDGNLTSPQFHNLTNAIIKLIKFQFHSLNEAILNLDNQEELHKLLHIISFLLDNQLLNKNQFNQTELNKELLIDLYLCEQLTINIQLLQCIQQVMIDFECLTWLNEFDETSISQTQNYDCLNSSFFYKGKLICSNIYSNQNQTSNSDVKLYLKLTGLINLTKLAKIKYVKWMPVHLSNSAASQKNYLLIIGVEHLIYATIWQLKDDQKLINNKLRDKESRMHSVPKRLINEALHFIVRLVKKTSLIEEIDYELRLQIYWNSLPVSLDDFKNKKGHILQKSFDIWNSLQPAKRLGNLDSLVSNANKLNHWRKELVKANIQRNGHLNTELTRNANVKVSLKQKLTGFNLLSSNQSQNNSTIFSIYNSLRSNSTVDSLNSSSNQSRLFDQNDPFANELQCELNALSRSLKQIRTFMVDYLVCFLIEDNQNSIYQSPILSATLVQRLGCSFLKKFKQNCAKLNSQLSYLDIKEIGCSFEARLPIQQSNHHFKSPNKKVILPLAKLNQSNPNLQNHNQTKLKRLDDNLDASCLSSFKTIKFWLHLIKLDNRFIYLCFIDNQVQQSAIDNFLFNNSCNSKFR